MEFFSNLGEKRKAFSSSAQARSVQSNPRQTLIVTKAIKLSCPQMLFQGTGQCCNVRGTQNPKLLIAYR